MFTPTISASDAEGCMAGCAALRCAAPVWLGADGETCG